MSATGNLVSKIIADATEAAQQAEAAARQEAERIVQDAKQALKAARAELQLQVEEEARETKRRALSQANLIAKKNLLSQKQRLMSEIYDTAAKELLKDDKRYLRLITAQLKQYAEKGNVVLIGVADKARITQAFLDGLALGLTLSKQYAPIDGGVIIRGEQYDVDLSLSVIMRQNRELTEAQVSQILFGTDNE